MPFGGAGPLHAREVAVSLGIGEMIVPAAPGIVCAHGLLVSDLKEDFVVSRRFALDTDGMHHLAASFGELSARAQTWLKSESAPSQSRHLALRVDARYVGQNFELTVPVAQGPELSIEHLPTLDQLADAFNQAHETAYGYASDSDPIEIVNIRLSAATRLHQDAEPHSTQNTDAAPRSNGVRSVHFAADEAVEAKIYDRGDLQPGHRIEGPAIIEQLDTTTPVYPGDVAKVTADGHLIIAINA
jgi:N-methylhydantoinase A